MKICTITCHNVYNHGASLQAFALMTFLSESGHTVEIIDYIPEYYKSYSLFAISNPRWKKNILLKIAYVVSKMPQRLLGMPLKFAFDAFTKTHLKLTAKKYTSNEEMRTVPPTADAYVCGSDQIWNCNLPNGHDPAYYLDFAPHDSIKMSYAASFAMDGIPEELKDRLRQRIDTLDRISVREADALSMLEDIGIRRGVHVVDPVFLLDKSRWETMAKPVAKGKYVLVFNFDNGKAVYETAKKIAAIRNCSIFAVNSTPMEGVDKNFRYAGPTEFLGLVRDADFVVTNSFHAIAFSLIFNVEFVALGRTEKLNSRMINLLKMLNLERRYFPNDCFDRSALAAIDYAEVDKIIKVHRQRSEAFIADALHQPAK